MVNGSILTYLLNQTFPRLDLIEQSKLGGYYAPIVVDITIIQL